MSSARHVLLLARRTAGLSQAELAERLGRPRSEHRCASPSHNDDRALGAGRDDTSATAAIRVLEHRRRWPAGPPPQRHYTEHQANAAIEAWLTST